MYCSRDSDVIPAAACVYLGFDMIHFPPRLRLPRVTPNPEGILSDTVLRTYLCAVLVQHTFIHSNTQKEKKLNNNHAIMELDRPVPRQHKAYR